MKKLYHALALTLIFALIFPTLMYAAKVETNSIDVDVSGLDKGYYMCAVWDGDVLLSLFDSQVGDDGKLRQSVIIGDAELSKNTVRVSISGKNISEDAEPVILDNVPVNKVLVDAPDDKPNSGGSGGGGGGGQPAVPATDKIAVPFTDINKDDYFYEAVLWAVNQKIASGMTETSFDPSRTCTRGHMVTFLWRAMGRPKAEKVVNPFTDVKQGDYFYDAVLWAVDKGITSGMTATTFEPSRPLDRAQAVTFLWRAAGSPGGSPFSDIPNGPYYYEAVMWAYEQKIASGMTGTAFEPHSLCTRAQAVTFLYRARNIIK